MRSSPWFLMVWVIVIGVFAVGGSVAAYTFVRDRAAELDELLDLPDPPQIRLSGHAAPTTTPGALTVESVATQGTGEPTPAADDSTAPITSDDAQDNTQDGPATTEEGVEVAAAPAGDVGTDFTPAVWSDPRRVTVLLLGIDQRAGEEGPFPTDTMILLSFSPAEKTAAILSIPRDLWVEYPGLNQQGKINAANVIGDQVNYPGGGGPALAMKTVTAVTGLTVDYYVLINFDVFITLIDAIGPIEVCPPEPIDDDEYPDGSYGTISIHFDAGCQELDSERLLQYARTRHGDSDIDRSRRQQEVIMAVRSRVLSLGGVLDLVPVAVDLWESVQQNVRTNLSFADMASLALAAEGIAPENIRQGQITFEDVLIGTSPEGEDILIPISTDIALLVEDLLRPPNTPSRRGQ